MAIQLQWNESSANESVTRHLAHEDAALARRLGDVEALVLHGAFQSAAASFGELRRALEAHLWIEERVLLPPSGGPSAQRRPARAALREHEQIRLLCGEIAEALSRWDQAAFRQHLPRLAARLRDHHRRERKLARAAVARIGTLAAFLARAAEAEVQQRRARFGRALWPAP